ncbi:MAG: hypothetical protein IKY66_10485 [Bacteroidales bacterium]|nr:hypothetical protein [Bacteroidales bacterium]
MSSIKTLYNRLQTLISENKNGIVAFCGSSTMEDAYEYVAYIHSLECVYVVTDSYLCYFPASEKNVLQGELKYFSNRNDYISLSDLGIAEDSFFCDAINSILWNTVHETSTADPEENSNDMWQIPTEVKDWESYSAFTLGLSDTLEGDIKAFHTCLENESVISAHGTEFHVGLTYDDESSTLILYRMVPEVFKDEETGEEHIIEIAQTLLQCDNDWRTLYAKFRLAYFHQLMERNYTKQQ